MKAEINTDNVFLLNQDTGEQIPIIKDIKPVFEMLAGCCTNATTSLQELAEQNKVVIEEAKEIAILEQRKKHCKNYLELKQINRRLSLLKFKQFKQGKGRS